VELASDTGKIGAAKDSHALRMRMVEFAIDTGRGCAAEDSHALRGDPRLAAGIVGRPLSLPSP
jgi:hypothetical protein